MGLLDQLTYDPQVALGMGLLSAGGPSRMPVSVGQALGQGFGAMQETQRAGQHSKMAEQQMMMQKMKMEQMQREIAEQMAIQNAAKASVLSPEQQALMGGGGPTNQAASMIPGLKPKFDTDAFIGNLMKIDPLKAMELQRSLVKAPIKLGAEESLLDPNTFKPIATGKGKNELKEGYLVPDGNGGWKVDPVLYQAAQGMKRAGATNVAVNTDNLGLKPKDRFEMEDKLRGDYSKAIDLDNKIIGTSSKMRAVLSGDPNAIKDQAAIYSFAKLLDPDGAVREADYAAITNTAGLTDRLKNYANKLMTGQMLNPTQRAEMLGVMNKWEEIARKKVSGQQKTYSSRAKMYNLLPENVFSPMEDAPTTRPPLDSFGKKP